MRRRIFLLIILFLHEAQSESGLELEVNSNDTKDEEILNLKEEDDDDGCFGISPREEFDEAHQRSSANDDSDLEPDRIVQKINATLEDREKEIVNKYLDVIDNISKNVPVACSHSAYHVLQNVPIGFGSQSFIIPREKADLIGFFIHKFKRTAGEIDRNELFRMFERLQEENLVAYVRYLETKNSGFYSYFHGKGLMVAENKKIDSLSSLPWFFPPEPIVENRPNSKGFLANFETSDETSSKNHKGIRGYWTWPYFQCDSNGNSGKWLVSYSVAFTATDTQQKAYGLLGFDIDLSHFPINQCDYQNETMKAEARASKMDPMYAFRETHKCDITTTKCLVFKVDEKNNWRKGNYRCECNKAHHAAYKQWNNTINGTLLESKWCLEWSDANGSSLVNSRRKSNFFKIASCTKCPEECPDCIEEKSCMAEINYILRVVILTTSLVCAFTSLVLIVTVFKCRKRDIFATSSPIFLCITLFGCAIMYSEMAVLYPQLNVPFCIAVKWTRHLGFSITYTALYMKLCRVYLTFRVKSAHKIKLTEKHLLHWMSPIMVIMLLYLFAWTISAPPDFELMKTVDGERFYQCIYNWWDHALAIGEIIFLSYGVWICWRIRQNQDAQFISYSIYNITFVNITMVTFHLLIFPKAGPDFKYLLAFFRTQMSTTVTIILVLGSKVYRAYYGKNPSLMEIANSANGFGGDTLDLGEENMFLKEELQKMATQVERIKIYAMLKNNPHLKNSRIMTQDIEFTKIDTFTAL